MKRLILILLALMLLAACGSEEMLPGEPVGHYAGFQTYSSSGGTRLFRVNTDQAKSYITFGIYSAVDIGAPLSLDEVKDEQTKMVLGKLLKARNRHNQVEALLVRTVENLQ